MAKASKKPEQTRMVVLLVVLAIVAVLALIRALGGDGLTRTRSAPEELGYNPKELPELILVEVDQQDADEDLDHRNPFTFGKPPTPTPNLTPKPTRPPPPTRAPRPTRTPAPAGWKGPPPPFDRQFIGHFGPEYLQVAAFRKTGEDPDISEVEVAVTGDVLDDIFIIREIGLESVLIGFVGWDSSEDQRVPLAED